jgi:GNAT superfamily N-acetyltransferase
VSDKSDAGRVREAAGADLDVILHHKRSMFRDMGVGTEAELDAMVATARPFIGAALEDGSYRAWLVDLDGHVVAGGGVAIVPFQPNPFDPRPRRAWILNMYTEPPFRRRGLARRILVAMLAWCREEGFGSVFLHASDAGRPLYESLGFVPTSEMRLDLADGPRTSPGPPLCSLPSGGGGPTTSRLSSGSRSFM